MDTTPTLPSVTTWLMSPYVLSTFGAVIALGFIIFVLVYFVFWRMKGNLPGVTTAASICGPGVCSLAGELSKMIPCQAHSGLVADMANTKAWQAQHDIDYRNLLRQLLDHERSFHGKH